MEVIVKKFEVSNAERCYLVATDRLFSPNDIEKEINSIISHRDVVSIAVTAVEPEKSNNSRGNTVELWYTIVVS